MPSSERLYSAAESEVTYELVRQFVLDAEESDLFSESLTFEIKEKRDHNNEPDAVGALSLDVARGSLNGIHHNLTLPN